MKFKICHYLTYFLLQHYINEWQTQIAVRVSRMRRLITLSYLFSHCYKLFYYCELFEINYLLLHTA